MPRVPIASPRSCVRAGLAPRTIVVNLQGDEPLMPPSVPARRRGRAARAPRVRHRHGGRADLDPRGVSRPELRQGAARASTARRSTSAGRRVPWPRDAAADGPAGDVRARFAPHRHLRLSGEEPARVRRPGRRRRSRLTEKLEQLRALEHGMRIHVVVAARGSARGRRHARGPRARCARGSSGAEGEIARGHARHRRVLRDRGVDGNPDVSARVTGVLAAISSSRCDCSSVSGFANESRRSMWALRPSAAGV